MTRSQLLVSAEAAEGARHYSLLVAGSDEIVAAQRLRYQVFAGEMGAHLHSLKDGLDADRFDEFCDHLVVREDTSGEIVGTYRMLPPDRAADAGMLYSDTEFDLTALAGVRGSLVETGRSCVHPDHRSGAVVSLVWAGIGRYMLLAGHRYLAGCASVPLDDGGSFAAGVWDLVKTKHYSDEALRVMPLNPWQSHEIARPARAVLPPLIKGYTRLGAKVCGPPAHDPDFGVADFFTLLDLQQMDERYLKFFLGAGA
ncbi:GNAT family N-acetyltransferase [Amycolatopsis acidicola]|uniref:GNAT family N-acetyltransferase n=1 Tax=Amycolatopsis acidicola TaxID=2596893 RepID=A0A5N0UUQ1_9PSEU|nr:GNAT family N-acyltransferase [Amycolatopsis acidicola]KAA9153888.1 GNAT family N-acetyltransferase [Amycolatopsis acidicola]